MSARASAKLVHIPLKRTMCVACGPMSSGGSTGHKSAASAARARTRRSALVTGLSFQREAQCPVERGIERNVREHARLGVCCDRLEVVEHVRIVRLVLDLHAASIEAVDR